MLFMGEEYGETAPFLYFVSHTDPELVAAVRDGRAAEFAAFGWEGDFPDPRSRGDVRALAPRPTTASARSPHREIQALYAGSCRCDGASPRSPRRAGSVRTEVDRTAATLTVLRHRDEDPAVAGRSATTTRETRCSCSPSATVPRARTACCPSWRLAIDAAETLGRRRLDSPPTLRDPRGGAVIELPRRTALLYLGDAGSPDER